MNKSADKPSGKILDSKQALGEENTFALQNDSIKVTFVKGMMMGAVELIPGVSAGTLALIMGILPRLLAVLKSVNIDAFHKIRRKELLGFWQYIDGNFLLVLVLGMVCGLGLLVQAVSFALAEYPIVIWSFFFGLILASSLWLASQNIQWKSVKVILCFFFGAGLAYYITVASPISFQLHPLSAFFAGMFTICAMILPGLSGSFLLMLVGLYSPVLQALKTLDLSIVLPFIGGAGIGVLAFSHLLSFLFSRFPSLVYALLTGIMLGSLNRIWPWKEVILFRINSDGEHVPLVSESISPYRYELLNAGESAFIVHALVSCLFGIGLVFLLSRLDGVLDSGMHQSTLSNSEK